MARVVMTGEYWLYVKKQQKTEFFLGTKLLYNFLGLMGGLGIEKSKRGWENSQSMICTREFGKLKSSGRKWMRRILEES